MQQYILKNNLKYYKFDDIKECFSYTKYMLKEGYNLEKNIELTFKLVKGDDEIVVSYLPYYKKIEQNEDFNYYNSDIKTMIPDYNNNFLNVMNVYHNKFTGDKRKEDCDIKKLDDNNIKHIVYIILDGLGSKILKHLEPTSFLRRHHIKNISAIYPPTTVAATTAMQANLNPIESGWLGWHNYFEEVNESLVMFMGIDYFNKNSPKLLDVKSILPVPNFYDNYTEKGYIIMPDFSKESNISYELDKLKDIINKDEINVSYLYNTMPDSLLHVHGTNSPIVTNKLEEIDYKLEEFSKTLCNDTILIITADHGHINCPRVIDLTQVSLIWDMLDRKPQNEARTCFFKVKKEYYETFPIIFNKLFSSCYKLYTREEFINAGFLGSGKKHTRIDNFIGDYVGVATSDAIFNYSGEDDPHFISHHAGLTIDEMLIPLIYFRNK